MTMPTFRQAHRFSQEVEALKAFACNRGRFLFRVLGRGFLFFYRDTPGILKRDECVQLWTGWVARIQLPPEYPVQSPHVHLSPWGTAGQPWHPNIFPRRPFPVCYGRHVPVHLLDELARRLERLITLDPQSVMVDESDALNPQVCVLVRRLIHEGRLPLAPGEELPQWCQDRPRREVLS
jgi:hypothetical protein